MQLLQEVRRRGILKVATAYLVVSWLALEIGGTLFGIFELPPVGLRVLFALLALGLPVAMFGAWRGWFGARAQATPEGGQSAERNDGPLLAIVFGAVAVIVVTIAIGVRFFGMGHGSRDETRVAAQEAPARQATPAASAAVFSPPPRSVAVLPFVNMSGDPEQEYFSDGLSEEMLNSLARIQDLQVAARTSAFSFKGQKDAIADIGRKLNVGAILEGSVRKSGRRVRITAQLVNAITGFHMWSQTYDRDLGDILKLQTEIATAITTALQSRLLGDTAAIVEAGGTNNPQAFDLFLKARQEAQGNTEEVYAARVQRLTQAIELDPRYAKAYAQRAVLEVDLASFGKGQVVKEEFARARADAERAIALEPSLAAGYAALGRVCTTQADAPCMSAATEQAMARAPGDIDALRAYEQLMSVRGQHDTALVASRRALALDPLSPRNYRNLATTLADARRYPEALEAIERARVLAPKLPQVDAHRCLILYVSGMLETALDACRQDPDDWWSRTLLAIVLHKLNRLPEAEAVLGKLIADEGDACAYQYAEIYAQWGDLAKSLDNLEKAYRLKDGGIMRLKVDPLLDPIRAAPRYAAIERKLAIPP